VTMSINKLLIFFYLLQQISVNN